MWEGVARKIHGWQQTDFFPGIRRICMVIRFMYNFSSSNSKKIEEKNMPSFAMNGEKEAAFFSMTLKN